MTDGTVGLRERKKRRTREAISNAAIALFLARGFGGVSVAEVADAAEVSKRTLFAYFPTKEDLVLHRIADHEREAAEVVSSRPPGVSVIEALHRHFRAALDRRDPVTGLTDDAESLALARMITTTPSLTVGLLRHLRRGERALTEALLATGAASDPLAAALAAAQVIAVQRALAEHNTRLVLDGTAIDAAQEAAARAADRAFALLADGLDGSMR